MYFIDGESSKLFVAQRWISTRQNHRRIRDEKNSWLKMFDEIFRHEKVEMIPTFSPNFSCKIKTNESAHAQ